MPVQLADFNVGLDPNFKVKLPNTSLGKNLLQGPISNEEAMKRIGQVANSATSNKGIPLAADLTNVGLDPNFKVKLPNTSLGKNLLQGPISNEEAMKRIGQVVDSFNKENGTNLPIPQAAKNAAKSHKGIMAIGALIVAAVAGMVVKKAVDAKKEAQPQQKLNAVA